MEVFENLEDSLEIKKGDHVKLGWLQVGKKETQVGP